MTWYLVVLFGHLILCFGSFLEMKRYYAMFCPVKLGRCSPLPAQPVSDRRRLFIPVISGSGQEGIR